MKRKLLFSFVCIGALSLTGCSTNEAIACYLPGNEITTNSPLVPGGTLLLETLPNESFEVTYNWSGPNNFKSNLKNPILSDITTAMAGEYKLKTTKGICESTESSVLVEINAPVISCNPTKNTMIFEGTTFAPITFNSVYTTNNTDNFTLQAGTLRADLTIEFASETKPTPGIYSICSSCPTSFMEDDEVCVSLNYLEFSRARSGSVYISSTNGKLTAVFCNVLFEQSSFKLNSSATITEK